MKKTKEHFMEMQEQNTDVAQENQRIYCKGCEADVTKTMYCHCGDFDLNKKEIIIK